MSLFKPPKFDQLQISYRMFLGYKLSVQHSNLLGLKKYEVFYREPEIHLLVRDVTKVLRYNSDCFVVDSKIAIAIIKRFSSE